MIFVVLFALWEALLWLVLPPQPPSPQLNPNAPCPACGASGGKLKTVRPGAMKTNGVTLEPAMVEHTCNVCQARWFEKTLVEDKSGTHIHPALN